MSNSTNDDLTWSDIGCFIAVPIWQQWATKRLKADTSGIQSVINFVSDYIANIASI